ncbi:MAG: pilus assembly protein TadG-related protein [Jatrophihabitantaceae bacterium]
MTHADEDGSTIPLILVFFLVALMVVAGAVTAGEAFVHQRDLQDVCDGAVAAAAASALDLDRSAAPGAGSDADFGAAQAAVDSYLQRDQLGTEVRIRAALTDDLQTLTLYCTQTRPVAFGAMFGFGDGIHHSTTSAARVPLG